ncbi:sulfatase-like hydrolase/transferase [Fulvivirga sp. M361]|nr:sulfatase-like hydrolase/transferase [Fulvivirga sp. M361]
MILLKSTGVLLLLSTNFSCAQQKKPNLILIVTDDQGYADLESFGSNDLETPNIDGIAAAGVRFTQWYANSPVCAPSRAALMTGLYPHNAGVPDLLAPRSPGLSLNRVTLADALKKKGYQTGVFGKWHLGAAADYLPNKRGFDEFFGHLEGTLDYFSHMYYLIRAPRPFHDLWRNTEEAWEEGNYMTHLITREAKQFIRNNKEEPFFMYVAYNAPHQPLHMPKKYLDRFSHLEPQRQRIAAMLAVVDEGVGEIIAQLKKDGLNDNTVVFFMSDNGGANNTKNFLSNEPDQFFYGANNGGLRGHKGSVFEGGIRVPACMSWPGVIPPGTVVDEPGIGMDIYPTFLKIAGAEPPDYMLDGHDLMPRINERKKTPHDVLCWEYAGQYAIRKGKWKLSLNTMLDFRREGPEVFLADLKADREETHNLAGEYPEVVKELRTQLDTWYESVKPNLPSE